MPGLWTYHLQDVDGTWLHRDLPLLNGESFDVLTGHCTVTGILGPENADLDDLITEWGCYLWAERGGVIRGGGIVTETTLVDDGNALALLVEGFTVYPEGQTYGSGTDKWRSWDTDAADAFRYIWAWLQARDAFSDLDLVVDNDDSGVIISDEEPPPRPKRADVTYPAGSPYGDAGDPWPRPPRPKKPTRRKPRKRERRPDESDEHWDAYVEDFNDRLDAWQDDFQTLNKGRLKPWRAWRKRLKAMRTKWREDYGDREPYKLSYWEETDMGQELFRLIEEGNGEWRERHTWGDVGKTYVTHRLQLGFPSVGTDKTATIELDTLSATAAYRLRAYPEPRHGGRDYANRAIALGAGEGRKTRKAEAGSAPERLRREFTVRHKRVKRHKRLLALARRALSTRKINRHIDEVAVVDATGTLGNLRLGDLVNVRVRSIWKSGVTPHKIVTRRYRHDDDSQIILGLVRAERSSL